MIFIYSAFLICYFCWWIFKRNPVLYILTQPFCTTKMWHKVNFFQVRIFLVCLLLQRLPHQGYRAQPALLFNFRENSRMHTYPKDINAMENVKSLISDTEFGSLCPFYTKITVTPPAPVVALNFFLIYVMGVVMLKIFNLKNQMFPHKIKCFA